MNYTGQQLVDLGVVFNNLESENIQQHGVDLNVAHIEQLVGHGSIFNEKKTIVGARVEVPLIVHEEVEGYRLAPGVYDITFHQGCNIPADCMGLIRQRSSLYRNGAFITSSIFDAGFTTQQIGTMMFVSVSAFIFIEKNARLAQFYAHKSNTVANLYNGQFQNDAQRSN